MIRFIDDKNLETDYQTACSFDDVFGTINSFLFENYSNYGSSFFWNLYDDNDQLAGNLSFVNDTFTICAKDDSCSEELAQFINFWDNFSCISYNKCNVISLDNILYSACTSAFGEILAKTTDDCSPSNSNDICKDINLYSVFCLFKESFPEKFDRMSFESFNYDMNYRIRKEQSFIYGILKDDVLTSALEVMCTSQNNVVLGCLATNKKYRGYGFATSLLNNLSNDFPNSTTYVFSENNSVTKFYKKIGFKDHAVWAQLTPARKD